MQYLDEKLNEYRKSDAYPFHMPGHKRRELDFPNPYAIDITEIDDFDNLHHAVGVLKEAEERAAALYGSDRCYYLVNGSTCGLLAAICAATGKRDKVLVARNCHKAVYHALSIHELNAEYLYPVITENDLQGHLTPEQVKQALLGHSDIAAVILTSPTYEGIVSDIAGIAAVCHTFGVPLIVDEAHGAHLGFGSGFPENALRLGADAVIMSLHKTLPSFTQTALLHLNGERIDPERVERYLGIFETSSPSYLFMAGMDACVRMIQKQGKELFSDYRRMLDEFYGSVADLRYLHVMCREDLSREEAFAWDDSKIVIYAGQPERRGEPGMLGQPQRTGASAVMCQPSMTGELLHQILRDRYHLQMEMVSGNYVLGMTSIMDTKEGFQRLVKALHEIDESLGSEKCAGINRNIRGEAYAGGTENGWTDTQGVGFTARMYTKNPCRMQIYQAVELPYKEVSFEEAAGEMSADYVFLYPPGIPVMVPGEVITGEFLENIRKCQRMGLRVEGQEKLSSERIKIVYF